MKKNTFRKLDEYNPAAAGAAAARADDRARRDRNQPFGFYAEEFWELEAVRQKIQKLASQYRGEKDGLAFKKAARTIEKASYELLEAGR